MTLLFKYIISQFFRNFLLVTIAFAAIYLLVDFFERIDNFMEAGKSIFLALTYFSLKVPLIVEQLSPVSILLSGVVTMGLLNQSKELLAMKAAGINMGTILRPIFSGALLLTICILAMAQWLLPRTMAAINDIWYVKVNATIPLGIHRNGRFYYRGRDGFYTFGRPDPKTFRYTDFIYTTWKKDYSFDRQITAETATWENNRWVLSQGVAKKTDDTGEIHATIFKLREFTFPEQPRSFFVPVYRYTERSLTDLLRNALKKKNDAVLWANFHGRISYIVFGLPLLLLGIPVLLLINQRWGRDLSFAIPASCGLAFVVWGIWSVMQALSKASYLSPWISAWVLHILVAGLGYAMLRKIEH